MKLKTLAPWKESYDKSRQLSKKQRHYFADKGPSSQSYGFPVVMYECESWTIKDTEHQRTDAFELWCWRRPLKVPWGSKERKPVNPKGNQPWIFIGRTEAETEALIISPPDEESQLTGKDTDAEKHWRQKEKGMSEDEMVGWHHRFNGHEFEHAAGHGEGQGRLVCCSSWGHKESDMTVQLNNSQQSWDSIPCLSQLWAPLGSP